MAIYEQLFGKCWFCQRRDADASTELLVEVRKETTTQVGHSRFNVQTKKWEVAIPRCGQCASIQKRESRKTVVATIGALLSAVVGGFVGAWIGGNQYSDSSPFLGCTAGFVIFLALYIYWLSNRLKLLPPEQRQDLKDAQKSFLEYPEIARAKNQKEQGVQVFFNTIS